jgi:3-phosphoshikimate 1-carboxyvinyltransferase
VVFVNTVLKTCSRLAGKIRVPPDKSITHRAVLLSSLANGTSTIKNPLTAEDCLSTAACVDALGCKVEKKDGLWRVTGKGLWGYHKPASALNCGNSGTTMRLMSGILAGQEFESEMIGDASLSSRPMDRVAKPLTEMGARFSMREGRFAPYKIQGTRFLRPVHWKNPVASAQVKSAVLLAGLHVEGETSFEEPSTSRDHTERMLSACGATVMQAGFRVSVKGPASLRAQEWVVPGDFSSAAFFIAAAVLVDNAEVTLEEVNVNPTRTGFLTVLQSMGAKIILENQRNIGGEPVADLIVKGRADLRPAKIDENIVPQLIDEIPVLAVVATQARGTSILRGIEELRVKESDRIAAIAANLRALDAHVEEEKAGLLIEGPTPLKGAVVDARGDHRIAMSMAVASLIAHQQTTITGSESVAISFPNFWDLLKQLTS